MTDSEFLNEILDGIDDPHGDLFEEEWPLEDDDAITEDEDEE